MNDTTQNGGFVGFDVGVTVGPSTLAHGASVKDAGKVRLGGQGPVFRPASIADAGKVRLGGQGPVFRPASIADAGKVRLGGQGPVFR